MNKYLVLLTVDYKDETKTTSVYRYNSKDEAVASFHKNLGSYIAKENVQHVLCMAMNNDGYVIRSEVWDSVTETENTTEEVM